MNPELEKAMKDYRAQGATDAQVTALYSAWMQAHGGDATAPAGPAPITARDLLRSAGQGATFGFSDELGLADKDKQKQFQKDHPYADFAAKLVGGLAAPAIATAAAPEALAGLGVAGVAGLGAVQGALSGAGDAEGGMANRAKGAAIGGLLGGVAAPALMGAGKVAGGLLGAARNAVAPEAAAKVAVAKAAKGLLDNPAAVASRMDQVNALAPGGSTMASAAVAPETGNPRFLSMARGVGADPASAASTEAGLTNQNAALEAGRKSVGAKIDALQKDVPVTPELRAALTKAGKVLGGTTPVAPPDAPQGITLPGFQPTSMHTPAPVIPPTMSTADLREAMSRLSVKARALADQGIDANGVTKHDVGVAQRALKDVVYKQVPGYKDLDTQYAILSNETRSVDQLTKQVERSRQNHAGNSAYGTSAGSLGGSLPKGAQSVVTSVLDRLFANKAASADAVNQFVMTPTDSKAVRSLLDAAPKPLPASVRAFAKSGLLDAPVNTTRGAAKSLLFPDSQY